MDATGVTRYLPVLVYPKGKPEKAAYIGHRLEVPTGREADVDAGDADVVGGFGRCHAEGGRSHSQKWFDAEAYRRRIRILPYDSSLVLRRKAFPDAEWVDALFVLERQRAKKSAEELKLLKYASKPSSTR